MIYRVIGLMSGSSLDGLDIVLAEFDESGGRWAFEIKAAACYSYSDVWINRLKQATGLSAYEYMLLHYDYGRYLGNQVLRFIEENQLHHQVQLISSHGHTVFHAPEKGMTAQLGDGAALAAVTGINVVSDLRAMDIAFGGQGAPIVPIGEKLLLNGYDYFLNLGGIANVTSNAGGKYIAFDICAANKVLNLLAQSVGKDYDDNGSLAASGSVNTALLTVLNRQDYYKAPFPKSLDNAFGIEVIYPIVQSFQLPVEDALSTYVEHIVMQVGYACGQLKQGEEVQKMLVTGGGALNGYLVKRLSQNLAAQNIEVEIPARQLIENKEALIMALIGILRWREEYNVISTVTGATRDSIGGAVWMGQEA